jgi:hypothetical protein
MTVTPTSKKPNGEPGRKVRPGPQQPVCREAGATTPDFARPFAVPRARAHPHRIPRPSRAAPHARLVARGHRHSGPAGLGRAFTWASSSWPLAWAALAPSARKSANAWPSKCASTRSSPRSPSRRRCPSPRKSPSAWRWSRRWPAPKIEEPPKEPDKKPPPRIVGLSFESTVGEGNGDGPAFATGNTRLGETDKIAVKKEDVPKERPAPCTGPRNRPPRTKRPRASRAKASPSARPSIGAAGQA